MAKVIEFKEQELTADDIFGTDDLTVVPFKVPEWQKNGKPGVIFFKVMSADAASMFQEMLKVKDQRRNAMVHLIAACACSSDGRLLFDEDAVAKLQKKNVAVFMRMQDFLLKLNGMSRPDKSWESVLKILQTAGVAQDTVAQVKRLWDEGDEEAVKND